MTKQKPTAEQLAAAKEIYADLIKDGFSRDYARYLACWTVEEMAEGHEDADPARLRAELAAFPEASRSRARHCLS